MQMSVRRLNVPQNEQELLDLVASGRPAVLAGAFDHWPITRERSDGLGRLDYLAERMGDALVAYACIPERDEGLLFYEHEGSQKPNYSEVRCRFREFAESLCSAIAVGSSKVSYLQSLSLVDAAPKLAAEMALPFLPAALNPNARLWVGRGGNRTPMHYDAYHNMACLLAGKKRFVVVPPEHLRDLYIGSLSKTPGGSPVSMVNFRSPDHDRFPRYAKAMESAEVIDLDAGETLFLPAFWFHYVESSDLNVLVNFWWDDVPAVQSAHAAACFQHALLTLRDLPPRRRAIAKLFFDHFVFQEDGDPYAHLARDQQGWAGTRTPQEDRQLREAVAASSRRLLEEDKTSLSWDGAWRAPDTLAFKLHHSGQIVAQTPNGPNVELDRADFEVIRCFSAATSAEHALLKLSEIYEIERDAFMQQLQALAREGLLVRA